MSSSHDQHGKDETIITSVAESIGSALGSIASHASAVSEALSPSHLSHAAQREGKKLVRKSKTLARRIQKKASTSLKRNKLAMSTRRALRGTVSKAKRTRPVASKKKVVRRGRRKK
jgi:hypothetical protein